jgi:hypothetical protein
MLDGLDRVVTQRVGAFGKTKALRVVIGGRAVVGAKRWEKVDAEFHFTLFFS